MGNDKPAGRGGVNSLDAVAVSQLNPGHDTGDATGDSFVDISRVQGSAFNDTITGDGLDDACGNDSIAGGNGAGAIIGGAGFDTLTGGAGADTFTFALPSDGLDTIADFKASEGDRISIASLAFGGGLPSSGSPPAAELVTGPTATSPFGQFVWLAGASARCAGRPLARPSPLQPDVSRSARMP